MPRNTDLIAALDAALPQTQCTRCGYPDCRAYAGAIAAGDAGLNQCPPGGAEGIARLAAISGRPAEPLNPAHGAEGPRLRAVIDEAWCIGCTLCIKACPVDCIVGASKQMHTVIADQCTGCELCLPVCPVDCIVLVNASGERSGWAAWSAAQAADARTRYAAHLERARHGAAAGPGATAPVPQTNAAHKRAAIEAAIERARAAATARRAGPAGGQP